MAKYILALDQGTTSSRAILFDEHQNIAGMAQREFAQHYPKPGWVEHDPLEIFASQNGVMAEVMGGSGIPPEEVVAIGITNQRETTIVWDKNTGRPIYNAIVWQCRRTADYCRSLEMEGYTEMVRAKTGLLIDAYFSGSKIKWILDHVQGARQRAEKGELLFGTVDTWLVWKLTGGRVHVTDHTNACRSMLYNIHELCWDEELCRLLDIPMAMLPKVRSSSEIYGTTSLSGTSVPIAGIAGDQQAALFGQTCFEKGDIKNTYGTGCFMLMHTGEQPVQSSHGLLTTMAASPPGQRCYALEGSVFVGGAVIQWLRDEMKLLGESPDSEYFASKVKDNGGVYLVPAFTGLGAPYWDMYARGTILGLTRGTGKDHIIRAGLESIAYQSRDVLLAMEKDAGVQIQQLRADGGASANGLLMQFQADITGAVVRRPMIRETTALGAAYLAGLATGVWRDLEDIRGQWTLDALFEPQMDRERAQKYCEGWAKAVQRARAWADE
ncbi:glycerol kinase GlpK [Ruminococcaceae bacterium OttesenSCG-928-I18]|nr:glycerol kinase GlpK [Ruminococcaceae bacterium OttesenSCG-928-I18]